MGKTSWAIVVMGYLSLQIGAIIFSWRIWPITDYPLFNTNVGYFETVGTIRFRGIAKDGRKVWLPRWYLQSFRHVDFKIIYYLRRSDFLKARHLAKEHIFANLVYSTENFRRIVVVRRQLIRVQGSNEFKLHEYEIPQLNFELPLRPD